MTRFYGWEYSPPLHGEQLHPTSNYLFWCRVVIQQPMVITVAQFGIGEAVQIEGFPVLWKELELK